MSSTAAVLVSLLLASLAGFQLLLVMGAPLGRFAWGGQHRVLPSSLRVGSASALLIYALIAAIVLTRAGLATPAVPDGVVDAAIWLVVAYFFLGIGMNLASRSRLERAVMSPVSAVLCALCALVAIS